MSDFADKRMAERYRKVLSGGTEGRFTQRPFVQMTHKDRIVDNRDLGRLRWKPVITKAILKDFRICQEEEDVWYGMVVGRKNSGKTVVMETLSYWWLVTAADAGRSKDPKRWLTFDADQTKKLVQSDKPQPGDFVFQDENPNLQGTGAQVTIDQLNTLQEIGRASGISMGFVGRTLFNQLTSLDWCLQTWDKDKANRRTRCYLMDGETHRVLGWAIIPLRPNDEWYEPYYWKHKIEFIMKGYGTGGAFSATWDYDRMKAEAEIVAAKVQRISLEDGIPLQNKILFENAARSLDLPGSAKEQTGLIELAYLFFQKIDVSPGPSGGNGSDLPFPEAGNRTGELSGRDLLTQLIAVAIHRGFIGKRRNAERDAAVAAGFLVPDVPLMTIPDYVNYKNLPVKKDMVMIILREARRILTSNILATIGEEFALRRLMQEIPEVHSQRELLVGMGGPGKPDIVWRRADLTEDQNPGTRVDINVKLHFTEEEGLTPDSTPESLLPDPREENQERLPFGNKFLAMILPRKCQERVIPIKHMAQVTSMSAKNSIGDLKWLAKYLRETL